MADALTVRGVCDPPALVATELGVLAVKRGYAEWTEADRDVETDLATHTSRVLDEFRKASTALG